MNHFECLFCKKKYSKELNGQIISVTDNEILRAQSLLAEYEGLFCLPASAASLAGLFQLQAEKKLNPYNKILLILTGAGVKNVKILDPSQMEILHSSLEKLEQALSLIKKKDLNPPFLYNPIYM